MATPPRFRQFNVSDFQHESEEVKSFLTRFLPQLNETLGALADMVDGRLSLENRMADTTTITLQTAASVADTFPVTFANPIPKRPVKVSVATVRPLNSSVSVTSAVSAAWWGMTPGGKVQVNYIPGLLGSTTYELTFLVEA